MLAKVKRMVPFHTNTPDIQFLQIPAGAEGEVVGESDGTEDIFVRFGSIVVPIDVRLLEAVDDFSEIPTFSDAIH